MPSRKTRWHVLQVCNEKQNESRDGPSLCTFKLIDLAVLSYLFTLSPTRVPVLH